MTNTITTRQMVFILIATITSFSVVNIPQTMARSAGTGSWITLLLAGLIFAAGAWMWVKLNSKYPDKMLFEYGRELIGRVGITILAAIFALYFFAVLLQLSISMSMLLKTNFMPKTPQWAMLLIALPVLGFVAQKGITNVARLVEIYGVVFVTIALAVHIIMLFQGNPNHILPVFNPAETGRYVAAVSNAFYPFLGIETMAAMPIAAKYARKAPAIAALTMMAIAVFYVLIVESSIMMVGMNEIVHYNYALIVAIRQVQLTFLKILQRMDLLYLTVGFIGLMAGISVIYVNIVEYLCRLLPKVKRLLIIVAVGAAAMASIMILQNINDISEILIRYITISGVVTAFLVPAALLVVMKVKNHAAKKSA